MPPDFGPNPKAPNAGDVVAGAVDGLGGNEKAEGAPPPKSGVGAEDVLGAKMLPGDAPGCCNGLVGGVKADGTLGGGEGEAAFGPKPVNPPENMPPFAGGVTLGGAIAGEGDAALG